LRTRFRCAVSVTSIGAFRATRVNPAQSSGARLHKATQRQPVEWREHKAQRTPMPSAIRAPFANGRSTSDVRPRRCRTAAQRRSPHWTPRILCSSFHDPGCGDGAPPVRMRKNRLRITRRHHNNRLTAPNFGAARFANSCGQGQVVPTMRLNTWMYHCRPRGHQAG